MQNKSSSLNQIESSENSNYLIQSKIDELINLFWLSNSQTEHEVLLKLKALNLTTLYINLQTETRKQLYDKYFYDREKIISNAANINMKIYLTNPPFGGRRLFLSSAVIMVALVLIGVALFVLSSGSLSMILMMITGVSFLLLGLNGMRHAVPELLELHKNTSQQEYLPYGNEQEFNDALKVNKQLHPDAIFSKKISLLIKSNCCDKLDLTKCNLTNQNLECINLVMQNNKSVCISLPSLPKETAMIENADRIEEESNLNAFYQKSVIFFAKNEVPNKVPIEIDRLILNYLQKLFLIDNQKLAFKISRINSMNENLNGINVQQIANEECKISDFYNFST